jgi:hypothetical protein
MDVPYISGFFLLGFFYLFYAMCPKFLPYVTLTSVPGPVCAVLVFESFLDPNPYSIIATHIESRVCE